ncbi:MAG TPA: tetratricopeptide repeat protein [Steroidobacteraceae bacterium]|jgi:tetratricopeptide (TPR) repeat protein|nr:tetratricopeptide repeat protein [Steroidobacteraceae bacterium]
MPLLQTLMEQGRAALASGDRQRALECFTRIVERDPNNVAALNNRGLLLGHLRQIEPALVCFRQALQIDPVNVIALVNGGIALAHLGQSAIAVDWYARAIAIDPRHVEAWMCRGQALKLLHRPAEAVECFNAILQIEPRNIDAYFNLGRLFETLGREAEAQMCFGEALNYLHRYPEALARFDRLVAQRPADPALLVGRSVALAGLDRNAEALECLARALRIEPELPFAVNNRSCLLLAQGLLPQGFQGLEIRWSIAPFKDHRPASTAPLWLGDSSLAGKTILVLHEQGLGDTLQFIRYVPLLAGRGARVLLRLPAALLEVMRTLEGVAQIVPDSAPLPPHDLYCPVMSLPLAFGTTVENIPAAIPYLHPDPARVARWKSRLGIKTRPRVGLVWAGRHRPPINYARDLPLAALQPLLDLDAEFISLQREMAPADSINLASMPAIVRHGESLTDFADTAALLANLDLLISVDTAVVHLAGALGKAVWVMNRYAPCWRWLRGRSDSPWYPTARLFRQTTFGDWAGVVGQVRQALTEALSSRRM